MRVRNRKGATELLEANPQYVVLNPLEAKGNGETCLEMIILFMLKLEVGKEPSYQEWPSKILTSTTSGLISKSRY